MGELADYYQGKDDMFYEMGGTDDDEDFEDNGILDNPDSQKRFSDPTEQQELDSEIKQAFMKPWFNQITTNSTNNTTTRVSIKDEQVERIKSVVTKRVVAGKIETIDSIIDLQSKQFNRWTQMDIANFFDGVGKIYRELKKEMEQLNG